MLYCEKCRVSVTGRPKRCPLCKGDLSGLPEEGPEVFPRIPLTIHKHRTLIKFIALGTVVAGAVCVAVNLSLPDSGWWSVFVVAGILSFWLTFWVMMKKRGNIPKAILWQVALISLLAFIWDEGTGFHGWSVNYVVPFLCIGAMIAMPALARIMNFRIQDYILYLILDLILGLVPLLLLLLGPVTVPYPSAACVAGSIITLAALLLFEGRALRDEVIRRLHL